MRINPKIYTMINTEPLEVQDVEGHNVEIYKLNDYPGILDEFTKKGKFAVWSSIDGVNYRLLIEEGYHASLKDLYTKKINSIWLSFWDECEKITNNFSKKIILPATIFVMVCLFALINFIPENIQMVFSVSLLGIFIVATMTLRRYTNSKISRKNAESIDQIKKILGAKKFEQLLEKQRSYIDEYFGYENNEDENVVEAEAINEKNVVEAEVIETTIEETESKKE